MKCISGKEWTTPDGQVLNTHPMFVKKISHKVCKIAKETLVDNSFNTDAELIKIRF